MEREKEAPEREVEIAPPTVQPVPERRRRVFPEPAPFPVPPKNAAS